MVPLNYLTQSIDLISDRYLIDETIHKVDIRFHSVVMLRKDKTLTGFDHETCYFIERLTENNKSIGVRAYRRGPMMPDRLITNFRSVSALNIDAPRDAPIDMKGLRVLVENRQKSIYRTLSTFKDSRRKSNMEKQIKKILNS